MVLHLITLLPDFSKPFLAVYVSLNQNDLKGQKEDIIQGTKKYKPQTVIPLMNMLKRTDTFSTSKA